MRVRNAYLQYLRASNMDPSDELLQKKVELLPTVLFVTPSLKTYRCNLNHKLELLERDDWGFLMATTRAVLMASILWIFYLDSRQPNGPW
jgi:hypothetical protein